MNNYFFLGTVKVWDPRQKNDPVATMEPGEGETKRDCWAVAFGKFILKPFLLICCRQSSAEDFLRLLKVYKNIVFSLK